MAAPASEMTFTINADTADIEAKLKRIRRDVRYIGLAAQMTLALTFAVAFAIGLALGLVVA